MDWYTSFQYYCLGAFDFRANFAPWAVLVSSANWSKSNVAGAKLADITSQLITVPSYVEKVGGPVTVTPNYAGNSNDITFTIPAFGDLERGQTVAACVVYHKGTIETVVNPLAFIIDGVDKPLTGGAFTITLPSPVASISSIRG